MLLRELAFKGYVLDTPRRWEQPADWTPEAIRALSLDDLAGQMPPSAQHVALLFVEDLTTKNRVVFTKSETTISAFILDTETAKIVWEASSEGDFTDRWGIMTGFMAMPILNDKYIALDKAFNLLFEALPAKPFD